MSSSMPPRVGGASGAGPARPEAWHAAQAEQRAEREQMREEQLVARGISDERVLGALLDVPRHRFVLESDRSVAYADTPLGIPGQQTISQPYIVASMTQAARLAPSDRVLEVGTGSGYQTAVLAELCRQVYSLEYLAEVAEFGRGNLAALGYLERNVALRAGDGSQGWPEHAPFDAILVTAAPATVPKPLLEQLAVGGRLVIPVGTGRRQKLELWQRLGAGDEPAAFARRRLFGVRFVPFLGPHAATGA